MAKSGTASSVAAKGDARSVATRAKLISAAIETLQGEGFAGASARAIAQRADANQGLIFYHFGSVANLLLAALDAVSARRMEQYGAAVERVATPVELVDVAADIFREDLDAGYVTVLVEMIAGSSSTPGLGAQVSARLGPWFAFARTGRHRGAPGTARLGAARSGRGLRHRRVVSRARDADASRRGPHQGPRSVRSRQEPGGAPASDDAGPTDTGAAVTPAPVPAARSARGEASADTGLDVVTGAFSYSGSAIAAGTHPGRTCGAHADRASRARPGHGDGGQRPDRRAPSRLRR